MRPLASVSIHATRSRSVCSTTARTLDDLGRRRRTLELAFGVVVERAAQERRQCGDRTARDGEGEGPHERRVERRGDQVREELLSRQLRAVRGAEPREYVGAEHLLDRVVPEE